MAQRALWSGSISFGLVNAPVRLYSAVKEHQLHFHLLHRKDDSPIGYEKICKKEGKPVDDDEIVKAYEYAKGKYVYVEDEDFAAARVEGYRTIDITDFVPYEDIDPIYFAKTYYVGPDEGGERVYSLLARAMEQSGLAAVAKFVMRDRQHLGVLRVRDGVITLEQLHFADEIGDVAEIKSARKRVDKKELEMAAKLIASFTADWKPEKYEDTYREQLKAIVDAKRKGKDVHAGAEVEEEVEAPDLMTALRQSVEASTARKATRRRATGSRRGSGGPARAKGASGRAGSSRRGASRAG